MKRILPLMGLAILFCGLLQPIANIPESPHVAAQQPKVQTVKVVKSPEKPVEAPQPAPTPEPVQEPTPAPEPVVDAPVASQPIVQAEVIAGCGDNQYAQFIYQHESGCRTDAVNSIGCTGIGQACPGSKIYAVCPDLNYDCQNAWFTNYAISRYGSWEQAYYFWLNNHWW